MDQLTHNVRRANWLNIINHCQERPANIITRQWLKDNNIKEKSYYYWQRKFRKESYDQMQLLAVTEEPAEISFVEFAAPTSKKAASTQDSLNSTTTAVIRHGAITLEISNDISEAVLSLLLGGNPCWRTLLKSLVSYLHVGYPHDFFYHHLFHGALILANFSIKI